MTFTEKIKPEWITSGVNQDAVDWAQRFAKHLAPQQKLDRDALTTSQLRKFFGQLRRIEADFDKLKVEIPLLKPKLAYAVGRANKSNRIRDFYERMEDAFKSLDGEKDSFSQLINLTESIVAFHKYYGGE
ncbi:MAG: type III-A CRISPR-associated protein Csm2 [Chitinophagaceae bacterium]|nr:type III-A CRISPR-associated protein Csm2 [Chitinophagaceae bacterium]